jgi:hypothetical protein
VSAPPLDAEAILQAAQERTGLCDYGDATLPERVGLAVAALQDACPDEEGRRAAAEITLELLTTRLQFFEDRKLYPVEREVIERPLLATGEPRSGTTLLHALLAVDPNGRSLRFWEIMHPSPPPSLAPPDDPRRAITDQYWRDALARVPKWLVNHPYNDMLGDGVPEDEITWAFDFRSLGPTLWWRTKIKIDMVGLPTDHAAQYRLHKMMLQQCQYARPHKYWVLKGFHGPRLKAMFEAYPDARLIWTHRDPVQAIASRIVMVGELDEGMSGSVDWVRTARNYLAQSRASMKATLESPFLDDPRIHHVRYADFVADPVRVIGGFYERYSVPFTDEFAGAIRRYLAGNRSDRYGRFKYSLDVIGEDIEALHEEFAPYRERFGLEIEQPK